MAHSYTPGLKVLKKTIFKKERILPLKGDVLVKSGDQLTPDTIVASTNLPGNVQIIGTALRTDGLWCSNVVPSGRFRPRIIHRSWNATSRGDSCTDAADGVTLNSFDFVVVSLCIPCAPDMHYETDFLSRCLCLHVPVVWSPHDGRSNGNIKSLASASFLPENQIWNHYMELPGSCLSLINRNNLISV